MAGLLIGQFEGVLGEKNRISLPRRLREIIGEKLIITQGYENSLIIVSQNRWETLLEGSKDKPFVQKETRETQRFLLGNASLIELDSKGRFIIPEYLRRFAKIKGEVIFIGLSRYVEMWNKENWEIYRGNLEKNIDSISQRLVNERKKGDENE